MDVKRYFESCADRFDGFYRNRNEDLLHRLANRFLRMPGLIRRLEYTKQLVGDPQKASILDIGCGSGIYSVYFAKSGADVTGIDFSRRMIDLAKCYANESNCRINFVNDNFINFEFERRFDFSILIGVFDYVARHELDAYFEKAVALSNKAVIATFPKKFAPQSPLRYLWLRRQNCPVFYYTRTRIAELAKRFNMHASFYNCGPLWTVEFKSIEAF